MICHCLKTGAETIVNQPPSRLHKWHKCISTRMSLVNDDSGWYVFEPKWIVGDLLEQRRSHTHTQNAAVLVPVIPCLSDPVSALWTIKPCDGLGLRVQVWQEDRTCWRKRWISMGFMPVAMTQSKGLAVAKQVSLCAVSCRHVFMAFSRDGSCCQLPSPLISTSNRRRRAMI